uniref:Seminal fluid protein HACP016 n=1 Tax=Strongyloides papillosus TaxID=174720 RepID=A0A0N5C3E3_STREA
MFFKLYLPIIAIVLVVLPLNYSAELDSDDFDVFYSAESEMPSKTTNIPIMLDSSDSESEKWYDASETLEKRHVSFSEDSDVNNLEKRSPNGAPIVRSQHDIGLRPHDRNTLYLRPQLPKRYN